MFYLALILLVAGIVLLVVGYRKNSRNMLLVGALVLFSSAAIPDFIEGVQEGYSGSKVQASAGSP